ncbi:MAG TPA: hypothetical protein VFX15_02515 [Actinomycetes bacterium]|nr:hypothetical protein [Actinomycetes bacterium]
MTDIEQLVRDTLNDYATAAPEFTAMRPEHGRRWRLIAPLAGIAVAAALVGAFAWFDTRPPVISDLPADGPDISEMTGIDLANALGLKPHFDGTTHGCDATGHGDIAYCLDSVSDDPLQRRIIALQIQGYARNDALVQYAQLDVKIAETLHDLGYRKGTDAIEPYQKQQDELKPDLVYVPDDIRGLTGEAVGNELGLAPMKTSEQPGCWAFAEYVNGSGFCYEDLTGHDKFASLILGAQINGHAPTAAEADYLAAYLEWNYRNHSSLAHDPDREAELWGQIVDLRSQLTSHTGDALPMPGPDVNPLNDDTITALEHQGIHVSLLDPLDTKPEISVSEALAAMNDDARDAEPAEMSLARVTVDDYLNHANERIIDNRLAWIGLYPDTEVFLSGPIQGSEDRPSTYTADMIVVVDATTGDFLRAETIS